MKKRKLWTGMLLFLFFLGNVIPVHADVKDKRLYFQEQNGEMVWNNKKGVNGNWFMSFTNMVPGESYHDRLFIENDSKKTYDLYFQVVPLGQSELKDELLEKITMKVTKDGKSIYYGNATGEAGSTDLQNIIYLGAYEPGKESEIAVDLQLDADTGLEYCDILTKVDWKFFVQENKDTPIMEITSPKTGDDSKLIFWIFLMIISIVALLMEYVLPKKLKNK